MKEYKEGINMQKTIVLIMAMQEEAQAIIEHFQAQKLPANDLENTRYSFQASGGSKVIVSINGMDKRFGVEQVGTQPAALNALSCIREFKPDIMINAGTAGGFSSRGANIGDTYVATGKVVFHDRRIPLTEKYKNYGIGSYACPSWAKKIAELLPAKCGTVSSGDSFDLSPTDQKQMEELKAEVKEMEAAAIAYVCQKLGTPLLILKSITDLVDVPVSSEEQFMKNLLAASKSLRQNLVKLLSVDLNQWV